MASEQPNEASIFNSARKIAPADERSVFLAKACGENAALRRGVEKLLAIYAAESQFLEQPAAGLEATMPPSSAEANRAVVMDAGLASAFGDDAAVVIGDVNHSVLRSLGNKLDELPRVSLRNSEAEGDDPLTRPKSPEMPERDSNSRYRLDGEIARGGMGAVLKGRDTDLGRDLAIKVLLDSHKDKPEVVARFIEEAQIGGQLQHPGIAPVYELGQFADQRPFFSMKLVKGKTLSALLAERSNASKEHGRFIGIFEQVCQTMAYAHSRGVIHRDLKPANIMVGAFGEVQVMDWGLAKVLPVGGVADEKKAQERESGQSIIQTLRSGLGNDEPGTVGAVGSETRVGSVMGTPAYMPPEQALGEIDNLNERADVFGLGAILCEILTGQPPYVARDGTQVFRMASRGKLDDALGRLHGCGSDAELIDLAKECLALEPDDRPRNAGVLAERVTGYLESVETKLRQTELERASAAARAQEERKRRRVTLALAACVLIVFSMGSGGWVYLARQESERQAEIAAEESRHAVEMEKLADERNTDRLAAERSEQRAIEAKTVAEDATRAAVEAQQALQRELYESDLQQVRLAYNEGAHDRVTELLNKYIPLEGATDLRRWDWYYWWRSSHLALREIVQGGPLLGLVFAPDRSWLAVRRWESSIDIYDTETLELKTSLSGFPWFAFPSQFSFSHDGELFAATSPDNKVRLWRTRDWVELQSLPHTRELRAIAFASNGLLAVGDAGGRVTFWNAVEQTKTGKVVETGQSLLRVVFSPDGKQLLTGDDSKHPDALGLLLWDVDSLSKRPLIEEALGVKRLLWTSHDGGSVIAVGSSDGSVRLLNGTTFQEVNRVEAGGPVRTIAFSPDGSRLAASTSRRNVVQIWDTESARRVATIHGHARLVLGVGFKDNHIVCSSSEDESLKMWDIRRCEPFRRLTDARLVADYEGRIAFGEDNRSVWHRERDGRIHRLDLASQRSSTMTEQAASTFAAISNNGRYLAVLESSNGGERRLKILQLDGGQSELVRQLILPGDLVIGGADGLTISNDASVVAWSHGQQAMIYRLRNDERNILSFRDRDRAYRLTLSPTGDRLAVPSFWGVDVYDLLKRPAEKMTLRSSGVAEQVEFSPDGRYLASSHWDNGVRVYDLVTQRLIHEFRAHAGSSTALRFSPDGSLLASGGFDGTVRLWSLDHENPGLLLTLASHDSLVASVAFSPDGLTIASLSIDGESRLWSRAAKGDVEENIAFHVDRARAHEKRQAWEPAVDDWSRVIQLDPYNTAWYYSRCSVLSRLERFSEVLADIKQVLEFADLQEKEEWFEQGVVLSSFKALSSRGASGTWRKTLHAPSGDWTSPSFDDSHWFSAKTESVSAAEYAPKEWPEESIWLRMELNLDQDISAPSAFLVHANCDVTIHVNGQLAAAAKHSAPVPYRLVNSDISFQSGRSVIAVHCTNPVSSGAVHVVPGVSLGTGPVVEIQGAASAVRTDG